MKGMVMSSAKDFVSLSKSGISIMALGNLSKKCVRDRAGNDRMIHSLESANYLKVEPQNFILFECSDENKIITVTQEYSKNCLEGDETRYDVIYRIKLHEITLRELLIFQSLYVCKT